MVEHSVCPHAFRFLSTATDLRTHERPSDCIRPMLHILQMSCKCIFPTNLCFRLQNHFVQRPPPLRTSPSFLPLGRGSFPRISTELRQMPSGIIRLRQPGSACRRSLTQCKCLVLNTTPAALERQHQRACLVCQQEKDCRGKRFLTHTRPSLLSSAHEASWDRKQRRPGGGRRSRKGEKERGERGRHEEDRRTLHLLIKPSHTTGHSSWRRLSIWAKRV